MPAGRPKRADPGVLYTFAHQFYWDFRRIVEGYFRWKYDESKYKQLANAIDSQKIQLNDGQNVSIARAVLKEVQDGRLSDADKLERLRELRRENIRVTREGLYEEAAESARKQVRVPGKPEVFKALLDASTAEEIRTICEDAFATRTIQVAPGITTEVTMPNWPIPVDSVLPMYLSQYAAEFVAARNDRRFPVSGRPSSQLKQLWFFSRALAGALFGVKVRTAINLVGSKRPEETFEESRAAKSLRKTARHKKLMKS